MCFEGTIIEIKHFRKNGLYKHIVCACDSRNYRFVIVRIFTLWSMEV